MNKKLLIKAIISILFSLIAILIAILTNALKFHFVISSKALFAIIIVLLVLAIFILIFNALKEVNNKLYNVFDIILYISNVFSILFIVTTTIISPVKVNGSSMETTFHDGQILFVSRINKLENNDIVVFYLEDEDLEGLSNSVKNRLTDILLIKRVIAIPGDTITVNNGRIRVNGELIEGSAYQSDFTSELVDGKVPENYIFVLGDNRDNSTDSRVFGLVPLDNVIGYVVGNK